MTAQSVGPQSLAGYDELLDKVLKPIKTKGINLTANDIDDIAKDIVTRCPNLGVAGVVSQIPQVIKYVQKATGGDIQSADNAAAVKTIIHQLVDAVLQDLGPEGQTFANQVADPLIDQLLQASAGHISLANTTDEVTSVAPDDIAAKQKWIEDNAAKLEGHFQKGVTGSAVVGAVPDAFKAVGAVAGWDDKQRQDAAIGLIDAAIGDKVDSKLKNDVINPAAAIALTLLVKAVKEGADWIKTKVKEHQSQTQPGTIEVVESNVGKKNDSHCCCLLC